MKITMYKQNGKITYNNGIEACKKITLSCVV